MSVLRWCGGARIGAFPALGWRRKRKSKLKLGLLGPAHTSGIGVKPTYEPARLRAKGEVIPLKDRMIAAFALEHGLAVVTRKVREFE